ncbi:hypothetical protein B7486_55625 [cyanobacterium TDX16]|nr:hypothetical protein B7486_55625 [cyanobacterium TDX16]
MLLRIADAEGIREGRITLQFRTWKRPTVKAGGTLQSVVGLLAIDAVDPVDVDAITAAEAEAAGNDDLAELQSFLRSREGQAYRVAVRYVGEDPRIALREDDDLSDDDVAEIERRLARWDAASPVGPWTATTLDLIGRFPGRRAPELAEIAGMETERFKPNVRKLKGLGLTISLGTGYRISPRGEAFLARRAG